MSPPRESAILDLQSLASLRLSEDSDDPRQRQLVVITKVAARQVALKVPAETVREQMAIRIGRHVSLDQLVDMLDALERGQDIPDPVEQASEEAAEALDDGDMTIAQLARDAGLAEEDIFQAELRRRHEQRA